MINVEKISQALGNDLELCVEFFKEFLKYSSANLMSLKQALDEKSDDLDLFVHKYRGMVLNLYDPELEEIVNRLDQDIKNNGGQSEKLFQKLEGLHASRCSEILRWVEGRHQ